MITAGESKLLEITLVLLDPIFVLIELEKGDCGLVLYVGLPLLGDDGDRGVEPALEDRVVLVLTVISGS
jgi:hypothetical protein